MCILYNDIARFNNNYAIFRNTIKIAAQSPDSGSDGDVFNDKQEIRIVIRGIFINILTPTG